MLFTVPVLLLICCAHYSCGNECPNTNHTAESDGVCLFSSIDLHCAFLSVNGTSPNFEWTIYPHNMTINASSVAISNSTISMVFNVSQENVFVLVTQSDDPTNCPLCNISVDISQNSRALMNATQPYFKLAVNQSVMNITANDLSGLVTSDQLFIGNPNTLHTVGECVTNIRYADCLLEPESFVWHLNGSIINYTNSSYTLDENGRLTFTNAQESYAGLYLCIITLPGQFGSFITTAKELKLSVTETSDAVNGNTTPTWVIVLIISVSVIILGLLVIIGVFIQAKMGFWCCYTYFSLRSKVPRSSTQMSMANKAEFLKHQLSSDRLLGDPTQKPKISRTRPSSKKSSVYPSKRSSLIRDKWECEYNCILFEEMICQGTFKKIHRANIGTHCVAVKTLKNKESELGLDELIHETAIQKHIARISNYFEHPNVIGLYGACTIDPSFPYCLILEYMECGTLDKLLLSLRSGPLPDWYIEYVKQLASPKETYTGFVASELMEIVQQIISAMIFLNRHGILHRDLSTRNVLISGNLLVKVGNFGMTHEGRYYVVTERDHYLQDMAPECINENKYSVKSDVWSFGILLYKICSLESNPYPNVQPKDLYKTLLSGKRAKMPSSCSEELYTLMKRCWKLAPTDRPTFTALQKYIGDYKYVPSNYIFFTLEGSQEPSDESDMGTVDVSLCQPPSELANLFGQNINPWDRNMLTRDRWSNDELYNTMRTVDTELPSEQSSCEEEIVKKVQMRNEPRPRDRQQKRSLALPEMAPDGAFSDTLIANPQAQHSQLQRQLSDRTDGAGREKYTPSSHSASKLFKSDTLNVFLEPAYKELLIPSESESSLDTDAVVGTKAVSHNDKQGGYRYAYP